MDSRRRAAHKSAMEPQSVKIFVKARPCAIALAAALVASPALAQVPQGAARAAGDSLLAQAGATDLFDNVTGDDGQDIKLKHKASGLVCEFNLGAPSNRIVVFDARTRGDDIACATGGEAGERVLYASHTPGRTLAEAFAHDRADVEKSHPGATPYALPPGTDSPILQMLDTPPMPASKTARFIVDHQFTSVSSAVVKDWSLEFRFTCPEERQDAAAGTLQPTLWATILAQISGAPLDLVSPKVPV
jgi:hypothetical protein